MSLLTELETQFPTMKVEYQQPLATYTYTKTGGPADAVVFPSSLEEVRAIVQYVREQALPLTVLGNASNMIVRDGGLRGVVMILTELKQVTIQEEALYAQAGASLIEVSRLAASQDLTGLEFACGIPGSIGGAVYMNAGAYGGEMKDVIESVTALTLAGDIVEMPLAACEFGYRHSAFQGQPLVVLAVRLQLAKGDPDQIQAKVADLTLQRETKQPLEYPSCGSVFKRPEGYFAGKLIQDAGLQGYRVGGAEVSRKHAGFIVNIGGATASDYLAVIRHVQATILAKDGVVMETEVQIIGEEV